MITMNPTEDGSRKKKYLTGRCVVIPCKTASYKVSSCYKKITPKLGKLRKEIEFFLGTKRRFATGNRSSQREFYHLIFEKGF